MELDNFKLTTEEYSSGEEDENKNNSNNNSPFKKKNLSEDPVDFNKILKIYNFKLAKMRDNLNINVSIQNFWNLLEHTSEGEIEKKSFLLIFSKIYKLILPIYNYDEIATHLDNEWLLSSKGKFTMDEYKFSKYLFKLIHTWSTHTKKEEYLDLLNKIFNRITKWVKVFEDGREVQRGENVQKKMTPP